MNRVGVQRGPSHSGVNAVGLSENDVPLGVPLEEVIGGSVLCFCSSQTAR